MACSRFLNFDLTERPSSRKKEDQNDTIPNVSKMITEILEYEKIWRKKDNTKQYSTLQHEMYIEFLYEIQIGKDDFKDILGKEVDRANRKRGRKRKHTDTEIELKKRRLSGDHLNEDGTRESSQETDETGHYRRLNSVDSLPSSEEAEDYVKEHDTEANNLLHGYRHLKNEIKHKDIPKAERSRYLGILDVEVCIKECHAILMKDVMDKNITAPGKFSVLPRTAEFKGEVHHYPCYETEDIADEALQAIILQYNKMIDEISTNKLERNKLEYSFKCASVLLFGFLTIHPFSDGNGRLARLLCSHCLNVFSPFPTAVYNMFSPSTREEYINAIVNARKNLKLSSNQIDCPDVAKREALLVLEQKPADLCYLIIESNWFTWRRFLRNIGEDIPMLDFEKRD